MTIDGMTALSSHGTSTASPAERARAELEEVIGVSPSFRALAERHVRALVDTARLERLPADRVIAQEGRDPDRLFLILKGDVDAFWGEGLREVISSLTRGGVLGAGLLLDEPHLSSFATKRQVEVASWDPRRDIALRLVAAPITREPLMRLFEKKLVGSCSLQDMPLPTLPVAVDIQTGRARIFRHGPVTQAMFASAALPALFPPEILQDGARYVDGGVANNVPVSALVEEGADFIIASNVIPPPARLAREIHKRSATRLLSQLSPLGRLKDGLRSMFLLMHEAGTRQATAAQITFAPSLGKFGLMDHHLADKIVEHVQPELPRFIEQVKERYTAFCRNRDD
ncbi:patatin-like phospholipase family protein [Sorangium sp. So ce1151]|uniref:patatin-like phospholipase family protein n=1 Tax=Sorangium sp. So ce1151 TaxID=3133332 RepID=UPI003F5E56CF